MECFYVVDPDYYAFELAATIWVLGLAGNWAIEPPGNFWAGIAYAGGLAGLMAGLKFTLAATSLLLLPPLLFVPGRRLGIKLGGVLVFGGVASATFALVLLLYYRGNLAQAAKRVFGCWFHSSGEAEGEQPLLALPLFSPVAAPQAREPTMAMPALRWRSGSHRWLPRDFS